MARSAPLLTEAQWKKIAPLLPKPPQQRQGGRPWIENRRVLEGILWILRSGARWQDLPGEFPPPLPGWGAGLAGRICRRNSHILRRAGGDCEIGRSEGFG